MERKQIGKTTLAAVVVGLIAAGASCSSSSEPTSPGSGGHTGSGGHGGGNADAGFACESTAQLDLSGSWAGLLNLSLTLRSQVGGAAILCPEAQTGMASLVVVLQIDQQPGSTSLDSIRATICSVQLPSLTAMVGECLLDDQTRWLQIHLVLPQALQDGLAAIPPAVAQGSVASLGPGAVFTPGRLTFSVGTRQQGDALPSWQPDRAGCGVAAIDVGRSSQCEPLCVDDCGALTDDDQDGWAGVTSHVCGYSDDDRRNNTPCNAQNPNEAGSTIQGRMPLVFQVDPVLQGTAVSSCELRGAPDAHVIYRVVGADLYVANSQISVVSAYRSLPLFDVDAAKSQFRLIRVDGRHSAPNWSIDVHADPQGACAAAMQRINELQ